MRTSHLMTSLKLNTCVNDLMYFPTRNAYGLSSVAVNAEKVAALQEEMENASKKMEDDEKKAEHMKAKYKTYTKGHERRAETVWSQIEASLKQIEIGGTEVECFKALKRQEEMAASFRKKNLEEEVVKQKETERKLQARYGSLLSMLEKAEEMRVGFRAQALRQSEVRDSPKLKEAKLTTGEEVDVAIAMEASA